MTFVHSKRVYNILITKIYNFSLVKRELKKMNFIEDDLQIKKIEGETFLKIVTETKFVPFFKKS